MKFNVMQGAEKGTVAIPVPGPRKREKSEVLREVMTFFKDFSLSAGELKAGLVVGQKNV
jgi:hypothetical protein